MVSTTVYIKVTVTGLLTVTVTSPPQLEPANKDNVEAAEPEFEPLRPSTEDSMTVPLDKVLSTVTVTVVAPTVVVIVAVDPSEPVQSSIPGVEVDSVTETPLVESRIVGVEVGSVTTTSVVESDKVVTVRLVVSREVT